MSALFALMIVPMLYPLKQLDKGVSSSNQYWIDVGLESSLIDKVLSQSHCISSAKNYLACVNAISSMAQKVDLVFTTKGELRPLTSKDLSQRLTEKSELEMWRKVLLDPEIKKINFQQKWIEIKEEAFGVVDVSVLVAAGINGYLSIAVDPHTYLIPLKMYEDIMQDKRQSLVGWGFSYVRVSEGVKVKKVITNSPADKVGLRRGDIIRSINGTPVNKLFPRQVSELFKSSKSSLLHLEFVSPQDRSEKYKTVTLRASDEPLPNVSSKWINPNRGLGLVTIHKFVQSTCQDVEKEIHILKSQNLKGLILDLRDNPGGQVEQASCVASLFLPHGVPLFETRYLDASRSPDRYVSERKPIYLGPLVTLINSGSASASEIVAGVLKDYQRGLLVGERSFGKGTFQDGKIWDKNSKVAMFSTEGMYYFPSGWTPQLVGIVPDIEVGDKNLDSYSANREEDLYLYPVTPADIWGGPQTISWLYTANCDSVSGPSLLAEQASMSGIGAEVFDADDQIQKASELVACGVLNDRYGSL